MWLAEGSSLDVAGSGHSRHEEDKGTAKAPSALKPFSKESNRADSTRANSTESSLSNHAARLAVGSLSDKLKLLKAGQRLALPSSASKEEVGERDEGVKRVNTSYGKPADGLFDDGDKPRNVVRPSSTFREAASPTTRCAWPAG